MQLIIFFSYSNVDIVIIHTVFIVELINHAMNLDYFLIKFTICFFESGLSPANIYIFEENLSNDQN